MLQDHNYGAPPPPTPPPSPPPPSKVAPLVQPSVVQTSTLPPHISQQHAVNSNQHVIDIENVSSTVVVTSGSEQNVGEDSAVRDVSAHDESVDDSVTRCICDFTHDDGYMIQCDRCR